MPSSLSTQAAPQSSRTNVIIGVILAIIGLCGHVGAAHAIAWNPRAYPDHIGGFFVILLVTGSLIAVLGRKRWRARRDLLVLTIGFVQAIFGIVIYIMRYHIA